MNTREKGNEQEELAAKYLESHGMKIVERNFRCKQGEIDIIGYHKGYLVFVEVKFRSDKTKGTASQAVDARKQRQICKVADFYRFIHRISANTAIRYDVIAIQGESIDWIQNAFFHVYRNGF